MKLEKRFRYNTKLLRQEHGLSVSKMANRLGCNHRSTYYSWERGDSEPNIEKLIRISEEFDIAIDRLLKASLSICYKTHEMCKYDCGGLCRNNC